MSRGPRDRKYGSSYDPRTEGGKIQRDQEAARKAEELRQHKLRGCGDPGCSMCNPETAANAGSSNGAEPEGDR